MARSTKLNFSSLWWIRVVLVHAGAVDAENVGTLNGKFQPRVSHGSIVPSPHSPEGDQTRVVVLLHARFH
jgi:hypothetical protein